MKHSPLPWKFQLSNDRSLKLISDQAGYLVAEVEKDSDAHLIVRAVNNEQRYREALEDIAKQISYITYNCTMTLQVKGRFTDLAAIASAALSEDAS